MVSGIVCGEMSSRELTNVSHVEMVVFKLNISGGEKIGQVSV